MQNDKKKTIYYLSGAITNNPNYKADFAEAEKFLLDNFDCEVINPVKITEHLPSDSKHSDYMKVCLAELIKADRIVILDHIRVYSAGVEVEKTVAAACNIEDYSYVAAVAVMKTYEAKKNEK